MAHQQVPGVSDLQPIGRGGTSVVYRGTQRAFGRTVAVKVLNASITDGNQRERFERECQAIGALSGHHNVVTVHDAGLTDDGQPYLVMEHLPRSVADVIAEHGPLPWPEAVTLGAAVASALTAAHAKGVLHRDVKPQNILIAPGDTPKLTDFGLARYTDSPNSQTATVTASFTHASPELVQGRPIDERSDVYSLASTLHECLSGAAPFVRPGDESLVPIISRIVSEPPPSLGRFGVPGAVEDVLLAAMSKDPARRPPTATAFSDQLQAAARHASTATVAAPGLADTIEFRRPRHALGVDPGSQAPTPAPPTASGRDDEPHRRRWSLIATVAAAAVLVIGGVAWAASRESTDRGEGAATTTATTTLATTDPATTTAAVTPVATTVAVVATTAATAGIESTAASTTVPSRPPEPFTVVYDQATGTATITGAATADDAEVLHTVLGFLTVDDDDLVEVDGTSPDVGQTAEAARILLEAMQNYLTEGTLAFDGETFAVVGQYPGIDQKAAMEAVIATIVVPIETPQLTAAPTTTRPTTTTTKPTTGGSSTAFTLSSSGTSPKTFNIPDDGERRVYALTLNWKNAPSGYACGMRISGWQGLSHFDLGNCDRTTWVALGGYTPGTWKVVVRVVDDGNNSIVASGTVTITVRVGQEPYSNAIG